VGSGDSYRDYPEYRDELGIVGPLPATDGQRRMPEEGFFTGPEIGARFPDVRLRAAEGAKLDLHADRGNAKAAVVFFRSAVW
jgi:hypothetical protein